MMPCREWQGSRLPNGYGMKYNPLTKKAVGVHRWVMAQIHGWEALEGKQVMHICDNPPCFRYDHLRIGTAVENAQDKLMKGRGRKPKQTPSKAVGKVKLTDTHINVGSRNGGAKLTEDQVREIYASTEAGIALASRYGVSPQAISSIHTGATWSHITGGK